MCTYLCDGTLIAFTGTLPPEPKSDGEVEAVTVKVTVTQSSTTLLKNLDADSHFGNSPRYRGGSKYNAGRKAHDHVRHIRAAKAANKRQYTLDD